ncbi:hypothetical protein UCRPC4_g00621 [Phaeomoniella chlamydospora]|uniref:Uncharacterized protein n=1 Tax=Phaeomoniella chlamydospora TaxID=158046 RepID=A0A0G2F0V9_PHACM|nr:hypothetical protein UCRPC4_g00621 [Phaeomoniella chlamydospora]
MAPKDTPATSETQVKPGDGRWLFTALQYASAPACINIQEAGEMLMTNAHNVTSRICVIRKQYGINIAGTSKAGAAAFRRQNPRRTPVDIKDVKAKDIEWFTQVIPHINSPVVIQTNEVANALGTNPHNVTCKISELRKKYGLNITGTTQGGSVAGPSNARPAAQPSTPRKKAIRKRARSPTPMDVEESAEKPVKRAKMAAAARSPSPLYSEELDHWSNKQATPAPVVVATRQPNLDVGDGDFSEYERSPPEGYVVKHGRIVKRGRTMIPRILPKMDPEIKRQLGASYSPHYAYQTVESITDPESDFWLDSESDADENSPSGSAELHAFDQLDLSAKDRMRQVRPPFFHYSHATSSPLYPSLGSN